MTKLRHRSAVAFSLIEVLVALGLLVTLLAGFGLVLRGGRDDGFALRSAQAEVAALLRDARGEAMARGAAARLAIGAAPGPDGAEQTFLRGLQILREEPADSGQWIAVGGVSFLPGAVRVVPPAMTSALTAPGITWPTGLAAPLSKLAGPISFAPGVTLADAVYHLEFTAAGRCDPATNRLVLGAVRAAAGASARFCDPAAVRTLRIDAQGAVNFSDDSAD